MRERTTPPVTPTSEMYPPADPPPRAHRPEPLMKPRQPKPFPDAAPPPEPRKVLDERTKFKVKILPVIDDGKVREGRVFKAGQVVELPVTVAQQFVKWGWAEWTCRVRSLRADLSVGDYVLAVGGEAVCAPDRAAFLAAKGLVVILPDDTPATLPGKAVPA